MLVNGIWLLALGWWEVGVLGTLGSAPVALADEEARSHGSSVHFAGPGFYEFLLRLHDRTRRTLIPNADHLTANLELFALRGRG